MEILSEKENLRKQKILIFIWEGRLSKRFWENCQNKILGIIRKKRK